MILAVGVKLVIGMILALTLNEDFKGRAIVRMLLLIPWALPGLVAAMTWKWMYNDTFGIINSILKNIGLIEVSIPWLSSKHLTLYSVIIVNIWRGIPFFIFSLLGGLQTIDGQLYEAAKIDGANMIRRFWSITVPSILPVISITTMLSSIWTFNDFENIWLITGGGPLNSSSVVATYTYQIAFQYNEMAQAVSVAVSIMPILIVMILFASKRRKQYKNILIYAIVVSSLFFTLFPIYWMIKSSLTPDDLMYTPRPSLFPERITFKHYQSLFTETSFMRYFFNSVYVASITTLLSMVISILGSYSMTRLRFRGRIFIMRSIILSYLLPVAVLFIPMYILMSKIGLSDNKNSLLIVYLTFTVPYSCYMLISYFRAIPKSLEEAALIDGCTHLQTLIRIILPIASPGIAVVATFAFTLSWNEYLYALVLTTSPSQQTVTIGISTFQFSDQYIWGLIMSSSVISSIPAVTLYLLAQRYLISGLASGGVKQ
jgi:multiple sugar transport system permease protein